jgi:hypothetical protein
MEDVLGELNKPVLTHLWTKDETIGWVYQDFNPPEERRTMRNASAAPRNSRELAVRNQFFTPCYVAEFLTDNTLGCILKEDKLRRVVENFFRVSGCPDKWGIFHRFPCYTL